MTVTRIAGTGPRLREITLQSRPKHGLDGRPIRLGPHVREPAEAARVLAQVLAHERAEVFGVLCLTIRARVIGWYEVGRGSIDGVWIAPRDVFQAACISNAAALILAHNHPSGEADPSVDDVDLTRRMVDAGEVLGIAVLDHIIIGDGEFASLRSARSTVRDVTAAYHDASGRHMWLEGEDVLCTIGRLPLEPLEAGEFAACRLEPRPTSPNPSFAWPR